MPRINHLARLAAWEWQRPAEKDWPGDELERLPTRVSSDLRARVVLDRRNAQGVVDFYFVLSKPLGRRLQAHRALLQARYLYPAARLVIVETEQVANA